MTEEPPPDLSGEAISLAQMIVEWVDGGIAMKLDWRTRLPNVIEKRLQRLRTTPTDIPTDMT